MKTETRELKAGYLQTRIAPASINKEARTVDVIWTTGATGLRSDWDGTYYEALNVDASSVRMERLNDGAPLLDSHSAYGVDSVLGVVERAWIDRGQGLATVRFGSSERAEAAYQQVLDGVVNKISVGYRVHKYERTVSQDKSIPDTYTAIDWEPFELSLVAIPFDAGASIRNNENMLYTVEVMTREDEESTEATTQETAPQSEAETMQPENNQAEIQVAAERAAMAERQRINDITTTCRTIGVDAQEFITSGASADSVRARAIDILAERQKAQQTETASVVTRTDETVVNKFRSAMENAIYARANKSADAKDGREFVGMSLVRMAEEALTVAGFSTRGLGVMDLVGRAMTTSDMPYILANVMNKSLANGYETAPRTFVNVFRQATANDFKTIQRTRLSGAPSLDEIKEHGEYKRGSVGEEKETYQLVTYGKMLSFTRQMMINDDLSALERIPSLFGRAAADLESDKVWDIINANAAMADSVALFHASHANLGTAGAISVTTVGELRKLMRKQTGIEGRLINVMPRFLVVSAENETAAAQFLSGDLKPTASTSVVPLDMRSLQIVVEPRLSGNPWYLMADSSQIDTVEYSYLQGNSGVYVESQIGFEVDGVNIKARHDFAAKAIDWRGMAKNPMA